MKMPGLSVAIALFAHDAALAQDAGAGAIVTALAANGCSVGRGEVAQVLGPQGFDPETVQATLAGWIVDGTASLDAHDRLSLPAAVCPPREPVPSPRDAVLATFRDNGCELTAAGGIVAALDGTGLDDARLRRIVAPLYAAGDITVEGRRATLAPRLCETD